MNRTEVGIIYSYNENWMGGTYYVQNLIRSFATLPQEQQPHLIVFTKTDEEYQHILQLGYSHTERKQLPDPLPLGLLQRIINKASNWVAGKEFFYPPIQLQSAKKTVVFPAILGTASSHVIPLYWIPDFQEEFLPHLFSAEEIKFRRIRNKSIASGKNHIVLSSHDALQTFKQLFPTSNARLYVLRFAVTNNLPQTDESEAALLERYQVRKPYFFIPNQFWAHKNHLTVLKALALLRKNGHSDVRIVFSGKEHDYRNPHYFSGLKKLVEETGIGEQVRFLGFIDRGDQLRLMNAAHAVVQPSLFEGWSTVVEDAKSLSKVILVSDLPVHREQLGERAVFFAPESPEQLAEALLMELSSSSPVSSEDYAPHIADFARCFVDIVREVGKEG